MNNEINLFMGLGIGATILLGLVIVRWAIKSYRDSQVVWVDDDNDPATPVVAQDNTPPSVNAILDALMPYVYRGIVAGEKMAVKALNEFDIILAGADKAKVADSLYSLLPDVVFVGTTPIPVNLLKRLITKDDFSRLVENTYDEMAAFIRANAGHIEKTVRDLVDDEYEQDMEHANTDPDPEPVTPPVAAPEVVL